MPDELEDTLDWLCRDFIKHVGDFGDFSWAYNQGVTRPVKVNYEMNPTLAAPNRFSA